MSKSPETEVTTTNCLSDQAKRVVDGNNQVALEIYEKIRAKTSGNIVYSPISAQTVLALAYIGAREDTADQMCKKLHLSSDQPSVSLGFNELLAVINQVNDELTLNIVTRLFPYKDVELWSLYLPEVALFHATVENLDYMDPVDSAEKINSFVRERTLGKIDHIITSEELDPSTQLVMVNTVYFKAKWQNQFSSSEHDQIDFHLSPEDKVTVPSMSRVDYFGYMESDDLDAKVIELKYKNADFSLYIVLPNKIDGLKQVESLLEPSLFVEEFSNYYVTVELPKFKIELQTDLKEILLEMGIEEAFSDEANFAAITENSKQALKIDRIMQKAFIAVDEEGTEAAAASFLQAVPMCARDDEKYFIGDRPFLYYLKEHKSNAVLFIGRVLDPSV